MTDVDLKSARDQLHTSRLRESDMDAWARRWGLKLIQRVDELEAERAQRELLAKKIKAAKEAPI